MSQIIFLTGPAGAGKSTTAKAFTESASGVWALIEQDEIRAFVKTGFVSAAVRPWTDEMHRQWDVSIQICCDMVKRYHAAGIDCIVEMFAPPSSLKEKWLPLLDGLPHQVVVLLPDIEAVLARNAQRTGDALVPEVSVKEHHEWFSEWRADEATIIDSTDKSVDEVVGLIREPSAQ